MCLEIEWNGIKMTADKDITVYKVIRDDNTSWNRLFPYMPGVKYTLNVPDSEKFNQAEFESVRYRRYVSEGFHAYAYKKAALARGGHWRKAVSFTIPKGAHYYLGTFGEIVSDQIIAGDLTAL